MIFPTPSFPRGSKRISIVIPLLLHSRLLERSNTEGRSFSNLCAYLLESAMDPGKP
jgi:hypothetical protein